MHRDVDLLRHAHDFRRSLRSQKLDCPRELALLSLSGGNKVKAVAAFKSEVVRHPTDAALISDLSAIYLNSTQSSPSQDALLALVAANEAVEKGPTLPEAHFNLGLALDKIFLVRAAKSEWASYLQLDHFSGWRSEALLRYDAKVTADVELWFVGRKELERAAGNGDPEEFADIAAKFPQLVRSYGERELPSRWVQAKLSHSEEEAARDIGIMQVLGTYLLHAHGDRFALDLFESFNQAEGASLSLLIKGQSSLESGIILMNSEQFKESFSTLRAARVALKTAEGPLVHLVALYIATYFFYQSDYAASFSTLERILYEIEDNDYPYLRARAVWLMGLIQFILGQPQESLRLYALALKITERARDKVSGAYVEFLMARAFSRLGQEEEAWRHRLTALKELPRFDDSRRIYSILTDAAEAAQAVDDEVALYFYRELLSHLRSRGAQAGMSAEVFLRRAEIFARLGKFARATRDLRLARNRLAQISDRGFQERVQADILIAEASLSVKANPQEAIASLTESLDVLVARNHAVDVSRVYYSRSLAYRELGEIGYAERDLLAAIEVLEREQKPFMVSEFRNAYAPSASAVFDQMISLQVHWKYDFEKAFEFAERARNHFLDPEARPTPINVESLERSLPKGTALIEYAVLQDRVLAWLVKADGVEFFDYQIGKRELTRLVRNLRTSINLRLPREEVEAAAAKLYTLIIPAKDLRDISS